MLIFLIGFMGSGKTYWAERWSSQMGYETIDLDKQIEEHEGISLLDIFEKKGEDYFRKTEAEALRKLEGKKNTIVSCGGGTACFFDNMDWMNLNGKTVYLSATPRLLTERVMNETGKRPLVRDVNEAEILYFIEQKLNERKPFYEKASQTLSVSELNDQSWQSI